jgi:hypothetical protein
MNIQVNPESVFHVFVHIFMFFVHNFMFLSTFSRNRKNEKNECLVIGIVEIGIKYYKSKHIILYSVI